MLSRREGFSAEEVGKKMDGRRERGKGGGKWRDEISAGKEIFILRKLVEWKMLPFRRLNGLPFVNC